MGDTVKSFAWTLNDVHMYETPAGTTFYKITGDLWYCDENTSELLTTRELAARCAREEADNNENERDWGYGE